MRFNPTNNLIFLPLAFEITSRNTMAKREISAVKPNGEITVNGRATWGQRTRQKIDAGTIVDKLQAHVNGHYEMSQTQINAARILLDRTLPVIKPIEIDTNQGGNAKTITNNQLIDFIEGTAERIDG
jgi:hypothetical protein